MNRSGDQLRAVVSVSPGGEELLRGTQGDRGITRCHCDRDKRSRRNVQNRRAHHRIAAGRRNCRRALAGTRCQSRTVDGGHTHRRRTPSHDAGDILSPTITKRGSGDELSRCAQSNSRIGRCHSNRTDHCRQNGQRGSIANRGHRICSRHSHASSCYAGRQPLIRDRCHGVV